MAKMTLEDLRAMADGKGNDESKTEEARGEFLADSLTATITDAEGNVVGEVALEPRAFKPREKNGKMQGGVGWYANIAKKDGLMYKGIPLSGRLRVSLDKLKFGVNDKIDLR